MEPTNESKEFAYTTSSTTALELTRGANYSTMDVFTTATVTTVTRETSSCTTGET